MWCIANEPESDTEDGAWSTSSRSFELTRELDPTRPVTYVTW